MDIDKTILSQIENTKNLYKWRWVYLGFTTLASISFFILSYTFYGTLIPENISIEEKMTEAEIQEINKSKITNAEFIQIIETEASLKNTILYNRILNMFAFLTCITLGSVFCIIALNFHGRISDRYYQWIAYEKLTKHFSGPENLPNG